MACQDDFRTAYHHRHSAWHHLAYLRLGKTYLLLDALQRNRVQLAGKRILDYGFGAGNFFRHCPPEARLFGVELDERTVREVGTMLQARGLEADLQPIDEAHWDGHPLLEQHYDLIVCSHVLEHLPDPVGFLQRITSCLDEGALLLVLLPINEVIPDVHHECEVDQGLARSWARDAGLTVVDCFEGDAPGYWLHAMYPMKGLGRPLAQASSLLTGLAARLTGRRLWRSWSRLLGALHLARPAQLALVLAHPET